MRSQPRDEFVGDLGEVLEDLVEERTRRAGVVKGFV